MNANGRLWIVALSATLTLSLPGLAGETAEGTVGETGFGKFNVADKAGTTRQFNQEHKTSKYEPAWWRPATGDQVSIAYTEITKGNNKVLRVDTAKLVKAGPETVEIASPVEVQLTEVGKSGYKGKVGAEGRIVKFTRDRDTKTVPTGWVPAAGEKVKIEFKVEDSTFTFGVNYTVSTMTKITGEAKPPDTKPPDTKAPDAGAPKAP